MERVRKMYREENKNFIIHKYTENDLATTIELSKSSIDFTIKIKSNMNCIDFSVIFDEIFQDYQFFGHTKKQILPSFFLSECPYMFGVTTAYDKYKIEMRYAIKCFQNFIAREMGL